MTLDGFIKHVFPDSAVRPMVDNEILQIVVFSIFFGIACAAMGARAKLRAGRHRGSVTRHLRVTGYVMLLAPLAVFCAMAATDLHQRPGHPGRPMQSSWASSISASSPVGRADRRRLPAAGPAVKRLILLVREPFLLAFSTASSEAAYPKMLEQLAKFPISRNDLELRAAARAIRSISTAR